MPIACFGEMLWDVLPTGKQPGGAPLNVAVHLHNFGLDAQVISRVGHDDLGTELLAFVESKGISTRYVQRGETHLTGVVKANVSDSMEVTYQIVKPVSWDYIQYDAALSELVETADAFVFGSLAARHAPSRETLYRLLQRAPLKVFDVNMRPPHYSRDVVTYLLRQADVVKLNHHELAEIMGWFGVSPAEETALRWLAERFQLRAVCVTKGADGAALWVGEQLYRSPGIAVQVQDTIGSGDAFLAALLRGWLAGQSPADYLAFACAAGSLVATFQGATPAISEAQVRALATTASTT
ncbi:PfkB domain protein [Hymenobacter roseosalivarius DSM 11622]|uniref:PfkB domain protein n=1 Tax=Hymenobacter roseosalivarius DSM 11622 TaxID=645990 RepID=A0A1W1W151_9BACT|nr:carbohydrate kinase [Hymenobacter roseosalivarius]SMB99328.1 PfkB domain protein [Hymenobacter roseosalivarius DSM 11622]